MLKKLQNIYTATSAFNNSEYLQLGLFDAGHDDVT